MRFLRGLGFGILMFFLWAFFSIIAAFQIVGENGFEGEIDLTSVSPIISIPLTLSFFLIFLGPLYYWVIEPIRIKGQTPLTYYKSAKQLPTTPQETESRKIIARYCENCGARNIQQYTRCKNCGVSLIVDN